MSSHHTEKHGVSQLEEGPPAQAGVFSIYKESGETLAVFVGRFRFEQSISKEIPVTYAGRLDPVAEGLVVLLTGETCKRKDEFLGLDKTYVFEVLFGVATDTFDVLGLITETKEYLPTEKQILELLGEIKNTKNFPYPPFSSKPVGGEPLFVRAKAGTLPEVLPRMDGEIKEIILKNIRTVSFEEAIKNKIEIIQKVSGDFRQKEIIDGWQKFLKDSKDRKCAIATFEATVSSGVYIRTLATMFGGPALAYSIRRIKVGGYKA
jgi:tRNA pseudouridine(55) synthase